MKNHDFGERTLYKCTSARGIHTVHVLSLSRRSVDEKSTRSGKTSPHACKIISSANKHTRAKLTNERMFQNNRTERMWVAMTSNGNTSICTLYAVTRKSDGRSGKKHERISWQMEKAERICISRTYEHGGAWCTVRARDTLSARQTTRLGV